MLNVVHVLAVQLLTMFNVLYFSARLKNLKWRKSVWDAYLKVKAKCFV
jgi:hypothetical protein